MNNRFYIVTKEKDYKLYSWMDIMKLSFVYKIKNHKKNQKKYLRVNINNNNISRVYHLNKLTNI